jgi:membrane-bound lytic murein transglycosylase A
LSLSACATTKPVTPPVSEQPIAETPDLETAPIATPEPEAPAPVVEPSSPTPETVPTPEPVVVERDPGFDNLKYWGSADPTPALLSLRESCAIWSKRKDGDWLKPTLPDYGQIKDWRSVCKAAGQIYADKNSAINFFETHFVPVKLSAETTGLLTGYYAPEIDARRQASAEFSEPVLARPTSPTIQKLPRKDIGVHSSKVLAYGRPIDVFFLQIQGSGRLKFADGSSYRAAFDGHNSHTYVSIGKLLIARGEMTKEQASKQSIEGWMRRAGPVKARALMNDNPRYIFFKTESLQDGKGPKGSMGAPLTAMGSMAIDPRYNPYGALVWLRVKLPQRNGDYTAKETGVLVSTQDTGGDIKGRQRGDLYFGAGHDAGEKAGVMKHQAEWTVFLPRALADKIPPIS